MSNKTTYDDGRVTMYLIGDYNNPEMKCGGCDKTFVLHWQNDGVTNLEYCPFCGANVKEIVDEMS